jgi:predicted metal-dependent phosphoesterase TrpH
VGAIKIDLHLHTSASFDCRVSPERVVERCRRLGLSPIVLTDHDTIAAALELRQRHLDVITGQEVMTKEGEVMGLFLSRPVRPDLTPEAAVEAIKEQDGLVCLQHPYDLGRRHLSQGAIERIADRIDLVEVVNGRADAEANRRAHELCTLLGTPAGAGSDAHTLGEIGRVYVEMAPFRDAGDFLQKLRQGRIVRKRPGWLKAAGARFSRTQIARS